jgi:hypothetical protein
LIRITTQQNPPMTTRTKNITAILAAVTAFALYVFCARMNAEIRETESEVRARHETAAKIRAVRGD